MSALRGIGSCVSLSHFSRQHFIDAPQSYLEYSVWSTVCLSYACLAWSQVTIPGLRRKPTTEGTSVLRRQVHRCTCSFLLGLHVQIHNSHMQMNRYAAANMFICFLAAPLDECWTPCYLVSVGFLGAVHPSLSSELGNSLEITQPSLALCLHTSTSVGIHFPICRMSNAVTFLWRCLSSRNRKHCVR